MRKTYPATTAGLRRMGRDMQKELEKRMKPVNVPVHYRYHSTGAGGVIASPWTGAGATVNNHYGNNHYGDVVSIDGDRNVVAVGNEGSVNQNAEQSDNQWRMALLAALGNVHGHLDELNLDDDDRDAIEDATTSAAAIAASEGDVDDALRRRGNRVLAILEKVMTAATGGVIAQTLAEPLQQLLS